MGRPACPSGSSGTGPRSHLHWCSRELGPEPGSRLTANRDRKMTAWQPPRSPRDAQEPRPPPLSPALPPTHGPCGPAGPGCSPGSDNLHSNVQALKSRRLYLRGSCRSGLGVLGDLLTGISQHTGCVNIAGLCRHRLISCHGRSELQLAGFPGTEWDTVVSAIKTFPQTKPSKKVCREN